MVPLLAALVDLILDLPIGRRYAGIPSDVNGIVGRMLFLGLSLVDSNDVISWAFLIFSLED